MKNKTKIDQLFYIFFTHAIDVWFVQRAYFFCFHSEILAVIRVDVFFYCFAFYENVRIDHGFYARLILTFEANNSSGFRD